MVRKPNRREWLAHASRPRPAEAHRGADDGEPLLRPHARLAAQEDPRIDGFPDDWTNPGPDGQPVGVKLKAAYRGQLTPDPEHHFPDVDRQIFNGDTSPNRVAAMTGFVRNYYDAAPGHRPCGADHVRVQAGAVAGPDDAGAAVRGVQRVVLVHSRADALQQGVCALRHVVRPGRHGMVVRDEADRQHLRSPDRAGPDRQGLLLRSVELESRSAEPAEESAGGLRHLPGFLASCRDDTLPDYAFIEPNYTDHDGDSGEILASDQHPDHHVREGDRFIASIYNAIRRNEELWQKTALLVVYDEHGGLFDHVPPPACTPDGYEAKLDETGGIPFKFDRLGVRVPAVLVSPWIPPGTVVPSTRVFEHASIPATVTEHFIGNYDDRTAREKQAETFSISCRCRARGRRLPVRRQVRRRMAARLKIVRIPRTPASAFDQHREVSDLVRNQVRHAHQEMQAWWEQSGSVAPDQIRTEQQAADYLKMVTHILHPEGARRVSTATGSRRVASCWGR